MYSWLVTVLLLASAAYCSGGQGAVGGGVGWRVLDDVCTEYIDACIPRHVTSGIFCCYTKLCSS